MSGRSGTRVLYLHTWYAARGAPEQIQASRTFSKILSVSKQTSLQNSGLIKKKK